MKQLQDVEHQSDEDYGPVWSRWCSCNSVVFVMYLVRWKHVAHILCLVCFWSAMSSKSDRSRMQGLSGSSLVNFLVSTRFSELSWNCVISITRVKEMRSILIQRKNTTHWDILMFACTPMVNSTWSMAIVIIHDSWMSCQSIVEFATHLLIFLFRLHAFPPSSLEPIQLYSRNRFYSATAVAAFFHSN